MITHSAPRFLFDLARQKSQKWVGMKLKDVFPIACLLLLIASEVLLFSANRQKSAALAQLHTAQHQLADLQEQFADVTNSLAGNESEDVTRLRAENQDIPRLRAQVQQLASDNNKLLAQLGQVSAAAGQRQEQLEEIQAQQQQAAADQQAQSQQLDQIMSQQRDACIANLRLIYAAKQAWALDKSKTDADVPTEQDLLPYLKGSVFPVCPAGGTYSIGAVGQLPTCSIPGHVLSPQ